MLNQDFAFKHLSKRKRASPAHVSFKNVHCFSILGREEGETQKPGVIIIKAVRGLEIGVGGSVSEPRWLGDTEALWGTAAWYWEPELGEQV